MKTKTITKQVKEAIERLPEPKSDALNPFEPDSWGHEIWESGFEAAANEITRMRLALRLIHSYGKERGVDWCVQAAARSLNGRDKHERGG